MNKQFNLFQINAYNDFCCRIILDFFLQSNLVDKIKEMGWRNIGNRFLLQINPHLKVRIFFYSTEV